MLRSFVLLAVASVSAQSPAEVPKPSPTERVEPQGPERPNPIDAEAEQRNSPVRALSLEEALRVGAAHNVGLRAAEIAPQQARLELLFAEAGFEPELYGSVGYADGKTPARNAFSPANETTSLDAQLGWRQRVITGGLFDLAYQPTRFESRDSGGAFPERQFSSEWTASYRQPLLRSAWTDYGLAPINAARYRLSQANADFDRAVQDTLLAIVDAYWNLAFARENWRVVASALEVAEEQLRITDERIRVQALAPNDRVESEAEVARRREELIVAENAIRAGEDDLRRLLFDGTDTSLWRINLRPTSPIPPRVRTDLAFEPLVEVALASRPDLKSQRSNIAAAEVALLQADRDLLPELDLVGGYSSDGVRDQFHLAFGDALDQQYPDWSVRLEFVLPIGNHAAKARAQQARLEVERQRRLLHAATLDVCKEVRDAVRTLTSLAESLQASAESVRLATTNLNAEKVKLRVGASTAFDVQRRNQELREAKSRHLRNQLDYRTGESRLLHAQGLLRATE
ncbi:MAG: TolC family protein [Planctomycetes bacterium]|nr:TolC family protein [Planctomycetota bacterium]